MANLMELWDRQKRYPNQGFESWCHEELQARLEAEEAASSKNFKQMPENEKNKAKIEMIRNHVEIDFGDKVFRISVSNTGALGRGSIIINKISYGEDTGQLFVGSKCSNEIEIL